MFLKTQINTDLKQCNLKTADAIHKRINKNAIKGIDLNQAAYQYFNGVDLKKIKGVSHSMILTIMSEIGPDGSPNLKLQKILPIG
ncbi:MAG: hypothetical protein ABIO56_17590 [Ferruginibacter sp.]